MLRALGRRLPDRSQIVTVYAAGVFLVYTWTLFTSFWKLPSWLFFLGAGEILSVYAYAFLVNFVESVLLLLAALLPAALLPRPWWADRFVPRGLALIVTLLASTTLHLSLYRTPDVRPVFVAGQAAWWLGTATAAVLVTWVAGRAPGFRSVLETVADRFVVFVYLYLPLTGIALLVVLARIFL